MGLFLSPSRRIRWIAKHHLVVGAGSLDVAWLSALVANTVCALRWAVTGDMADLAT